MNRAACRVLMLLENAPFRLDSRVYPEATTLAAAGHRVTVICPTFQREPWRENVAGVRVYRYPALFGGSGFLAYAWEYGYSLVAMFVLSLLALLDGFDVIHAHNPPDTACLIAAVYKPFGKRFVYDHHDMAPEMYRALFRKGDGRVVRALILMEQLSCRMADHIIAANESHKRILAKRSGVALDRISVVRNGPDPRVIGAGEADARLRRPGKQLLCYVGVMGRHDGVDYLLRALHHLVYELGREDVLCVLAGYGSAWPELRRLAEQLRLGPYVLWAGWVAPDDVPRYLRSADICVAPEPSNDYNDSCTVIKIAEYMAAGKPVVAFDLPEHRYTAGDAALYAAPNSEVDMARQIALLLDDGALRQQLGARGRSRVERELAWQHQSVRLLEIYRSRPLLRPRPI